MEFSLKRETVGESYISYQIFGTPGTQAEFGKFALANLANDASPRCSEDSVGDVAFSYRFLFERKFHSKILVEKIRQIFSYSVFSLDS